MDLVLRRTTFVRQRFQSYKPKPLTELLVALVFEFGFLSCVAVLSGEFTNIVRRLTALTVPQFNVSSDVGMNFSNLVDASMSFVVLTGLSKFTSSRLKVGQMEATKVWNRCRDA
jgi:hypothetical protein